MPERVDRFVSVAGWLADWASQSERPIVVELHRLPDGENSHLRAEESYGLSGDGATISTGGQRGGGAICKAVAGLSGDPAKWLGGEFLGQWASFQRIRIRMEVNRFPFGSRARMKERLKASERSVHWTSGSWPTIGVGAAASSDGDLGLAGPPGSLVVVARPTDEAAFVSMGEGSV